MFTEFEEVLMYLLQTEALFVGKLFAWDVHRGPSQPEGVSKLHFNFHVHTLVYFKTIPYVPCAYKRPGRNVDPRVQYECSHLELPGNKHSNGSPKIASSEMREKKEKATEKKIGVSGNICSKLYW